MNKHDMKNTDSRIWRVGITKDYTVEDVRDAMIERHASDITKRVDGIRM